MRATDHRFSDAVNRQARFSRAIWTIYRENYDETEEVESYIFKDVGHRWPKTVTASARYQQ